MLTGDSRVCCATLQDGNFIKVDKKGAMITERAAVEVLDATLV
jgi:hypothetical protein